MTKSKNTKRALLMSILSMLLCVSMLVSSTFAWFTDSVTSGKNKIVAGNLDIELKYQNASMTSFEEVKADTEDLFVTKEGGVINWEPGAAAVTYLELRNAGTLALKYQLSVDANDTVTGSDGAALSKVLKTAVVEIAQNKVGSYTRETAIAAAEATEANSVLTYVKPGTMTEQNETLYLAMIVYFPKEIENTYDGALYNCSDVKLETELSLNLVATQTPHEEDSFDKDYDEKAIYQWDDDSTARIGNTFYKTLKEAVDAAQDNDTIMLYNGTLSDKDSVSVNKNLTIIGTGNKESELNGVQLYVGNNVKLTLKNIHFTGKSAVLTDQTGNNEISINDCLIEAAFNHSAYGRAAFILGRHQSQATKLTITNNTFLRYAADDLHATAIFTWNAIQSGSMIKGNTFGSEDNRFTFAAIKIMNSANDGGLISLCDNELYGTNDCWVVQLAFQHDYNVKFLFKDNAFNGGRMAIDLDPGNGATKYTKTEVYISDGNTYNGSALTSNQVEDYGDKYSDNSINWGDPT